MVFHQLLYYSQTLEAGTYSEVGPGIPMLNDKAVKYLAGAISSSSRVSPGMGAMREVMALALSRILSGLSEAKSSVVVISFGAIPCSLKSFSKKKQTKKTTLNRIKYLQLAIWVEVAS